MARCHFFGQDWGSLVGLRVVAEGVETRDQADFLSQRAPDIVYQGYLFGRPEPDTDWLARAALVGTATVEDEG